MNMIEQVVEQIVREEIRSVIASIVRSELAKVTGSVPVAEQVEPCSEGRGRPRGKFTARLSELEKGRFINVSVSNLRRARNSVRYVTKKFGMLFSVYKYGKGYRIFCMQGKAA